MTETPTQETQPEVPATPVQKLALLIDAYADAKKSGNETLVRLAVEPLQAFLQTHEIIAPPEGVADVVTPEIADPPMT